MILFIEAAEAVGDSSQQSLHLNSIILIQQPNSNMGQFEYGPQSIFVFDTKNNSFFVGSLVPPNLFIAAR
jgi:hypothetical protein